MAQWISLPLTVSCFSKIQIGFTFLVPAHPGSPGQRAVKRVCVCIGAVIWYQPVSFWLISWLWLYIFSFCCYHFGFEIELFCENICQWLKVIKVRRQCRKHSWGELQLQRLLPNPPVLNWRCRLTQVDLYNGRKTVVVLLLSVIKTEFLKLYKDVVMKILKTFLNINWHIGLVYDLSSL